MKISLKSQIILTTILLTPFLTFAQTGGINTSSIQKYSNDIVSIINDFIVPVILAIAFLVFLWGIYKYFIAGATNEESLKEGRQLVIWGILGFVIIFTLWAIVRMLMDTLGLSEKTPAPTPPTFNPSGSSSGTNGSLPGPTYNI